MQSAFSYTYYILTALVSVLERRIFGLNSFLRSSFFASFSVSERSISRSFFEVVRKIAEIIVATHFAYFKDSVLCISEKSFRLLYSIKYQILMQGSAKRSLHKSVQMIWMISENLCELYMALILYDIRRQRNNYNLEGYLQYLLCYLMYSRNAGILAEETDEY